MDRFENENQAKMKAQRAAFEGAKSAVPLGGERADSCNQTQTNAAPGMYRRSLADEHDHNAAYHCDQADRNARAAAFLRTNPAFEEFITLLRTGAIQF